MQLRNRNDQRIFWGLKFSILRFFEGRKINLPSMYVFEWLDLRRKFFFFVVGGGGLGLLLL